MSYHLTCVQVDFQGFFEPQKRDNSENELEKVKKLATSFYVLFEDSCFDSHSLQYQKLKQQSRTGSA